MKAGTSKSSRAQRVKLFVEAYLSNGGNATNAAITAGYSKKTARSAGARLFADVDISTAIEKRRAEALAKAEDATGVSIERTLRELGRIAYFDPAKLFDEDGKLLHPAQMSPETRAALAKVKVQRKAGSMKIMLGKPKEGEAPIEHIPEEVVELTIWDKNSALEKAMKHLGLFEKDNDQSRPLIVPKITIVPVRAQTADKAAR